MASRSLPWWLCVLLISRPYNSIVVSATTTVHFYTDSSCKTPYGTVQTDSDAGDGQCGEFPTSINSASSSFIDDGCSGIYHVPPGVALERCCTDYCLLPVTAYTGSGSLFCDNNNTNVPTDLCTGMSIGSFSVDCPNINGTNDLGYTTILASVVSLRTSSPPSTSTSTSSVSVAPSPASQKSTATETPPTPSSPTTSPPPEAPTSPLRDIRISSSPTTSPLPEVLTSLLLDIGTSSSTSQPPSSSSSSSSSLSSSSSSSPPSPSPSTSQASRGSGNDGGLSGPSTIAIGVVLPGVAVIVAIIFGVLGVKVWRRKGP